MVNYACTIPCTALGAANTEVSRVQILIELSKAISKLWEDRPVPMRHIFMCVGGGGGIHIDTLASVNQR